MLKFFFRKAVKETADVKFNEQSDPYLERLAREVVLQKKEESAKLTEQQKAKETK